MKYRTLVAEFSFSFDAVKTVATGYGLKNCCDRVWCACRVRGRRRGQWWCCCCCWCKSWRWLRRWSIHQLSRWNNVANPSLAPMLLTGNEENLASKGNVYFEHIPIKWVVWDQHIRNVLTCSMSHASPTELLNIQMCVALFFILNFVGDFSTIWMKG